MWYISESAVPASSHLPSKQDGLSIAGCDREVIVWHPTSHLFILFMISHRGLCQGMHCFRLVFLHRQHKTLRLSGAIIFLWYPERMFFKVKYYLCKKWASISFVFAYREFAFSPGWHPRKTFKIEFLNKKRNVCEDKQFRSFRSNLHPN